MGGRGRDWALTNMFVTRRLITAKYFYPLKSALLALLSFPDDTTLESQREPINPLIRVNLYIIFHKFLISFIRSQVS